MSGVVKYCSNCGAGLIGAGRYCAACGEANREELAPQDHRSTMPIDRAKWRGSAIAAVVVAAVLLAGSVALALGLAPTAPARAAIVSPTVAVTATSTATVTAPPTAAPVVVVVATPTPDLAVQTFISQRTARVQAFAPYVVAVGSACSSPSAACSAAYDKNWPLYVEAIKDPSTIAVPTKCADAERKYSSYVSASTSFLGTINVATLYTKDQLAFLKMTNPALDKMTTALGAYTDELKYGTCRP